MRRPLSALNARRWLKPWLPALGFRLGVLSFVSACLGLLLLVLLGKFAPELARVDAGPLAVNVLPLCTREPELVPVDVASLNVQMDVRVLTILMDRHQCARLWEAVLQILPRHAEHPLSRFPALARGDGAEVRLRLPTPAAARSQQFVMLLLVRVIDQVGAQFVVGVACACVLWIVVRVNRGPLALRAGRSGDVARVGSARACSTCPELEIDAAGCAHKPPLP